MQTQDKQTIELKTLTAIRYITPLREGGSLPAIVEADDGQMYVMKFIGAGQGPKALVAELLAGEIGRSLGLHVPELVLLELDPRLGQSEPNAEIQDLLRASAGRLNLGLRYLPQALEFNALLKPPLDPSLASAIVWFDAYITNVDRTARNVNMLLWQNDLWLIDHGAALYFHHNWGDYLARSRTPFSQIKQHVLISFASALRQADAAMRPRLTSAMIEHIVSLIPAPWLNHEDNFSGPAQIRAAYVAYLVNRLEASTIFVEEAVHAHSQSL